MPGDDRPRCAPSGTPPGRRASTGVSNRGGCRGQARDYSRGSCAVLDRRGGGVAQPAGLPAAQVRHRGCRLREPGRHRELPDRRLAGRAASQPAPASGARPVEGRAVCQPAASEALYTGFPAPARKTRPQQARARSMSKSRCAGAVAVAMNHAKAASGGQRRGRKARGMPQPRQLQNRRPDVQGSPAGHRPPQAAARPLAGRTPASKAAADPAARLPPVRPGSARGVRSA